MLCSARFFSCLIPDPFLPYSSVVVLPYCGWALPRPDRESSVVSTLPLAKSVEIAFKFIRACFFRSLVIIVSLVLAVAFLCYVQAGNEPANGLLHSDHPGALRILLHAGYDVNADPRPSARVPNSSGS